MRCIQLVHACFSQKSGVPTALTAHNVCVHDGAPHSTPNGSPRGRHPVISHLHTPSQSTLPPTHMTSKSLKRARHKAAVKQQEAAASGPPPPTAAPNGGPKTQRRRDWARAVSEDMTAGRWQEALQGLSHMRASGQVRAGGRRLCRGWFVACYRHPNGSMW